MRAQRALAASLVACVWCMSLVARADGGGICMALASEAVVVDAAEPGADVYAVQGQRWLTTDLQKRYAPPPQPPETVASVRLQLQRVRVTFAASTVFESQAGKRLQARLLEEIALIERAIGKLEPGQHLTLEQLKDRYGLARLDQTSGASETCDSKTYTSDSLFFQDATANEQVVLRVTSQESAGVPGLPIPVTGKTISFVTVAEASEFRAALEALRKLLSYPLLKSVERASRRLTELSRSWSNYLEHGFSQYPWEAWINSAGTLRWDEAPWSQWIVLHPELAVVLDARRVKDSSAAPALLVHALGFAVYGETRSWFVGASLTGAVTTNAAWGLGAGGTLHFGHTQVYSKVPHISLTVLMFPSDGGKVGPYVGLSADFWRLVSDNDEELFKKQLEQ